MAKAKYYVTTPVFDAAREPQIGALYAAILGDAIARHRRMCAFDVAFFAGTDTHAENPENSTKTAASARAGSFERHSQKYRELLNLVDVHWTHFERAFSAEHFLAVDTMLRRILRRSRLSIYKGRYQGRRCLHDQIDVSDSAEPANCGICGQAAALVSEERYFFRLSSFQGRLTTLYKHRPQLVQPHFRFQVIKNSVAGGLKDISISRASAEKGIPWPGDAGQIVSPSFAELACYLSGVGFGQGGHGSDEFAKYWPANVHVVSHEALRTHAIFWPAALMAADLRWPSHIFAHGTLSLEPEENNQALFSEANLQALGSDRVRWYLLCEGGYGENARLSTSGLARRTHADLDEGLGKLANRILTLVARHCDGKIPGRSMFSRVDPVIEILSADIRAEVRFALDAFNFHEALKKIWSLLEAIDKLLTDHARFELAEDPGDKQRFIDALSDACEGLGLLALLLHPVLPRSTGAIWRSLGQRTRLEDQLIVETPWNCLMPGTPIGKPEVLFPGMGKLQQAASAKTETGPSG
jgi:methionyl-tRNA synthetase